MLRHLPVYPESGMVNGNLLSAKCYPESRGEFAGELEPTEDTDGRFLAVQASF